MSDPAPATAILTPVNDNTQPKPGWKTSEFWLKLLALLLTALYASGVIPTTGAIAAVAAIAATMLGALGYAVVRSNVKAAHALAAAHAQLGELEPVNDNATSRQGQAQSGFVAARLMLPLAIAALAAIGATAMLTTGCGSQQKSAEQSFAGCTKDAAEQALEPTVITILTAGVANWKQQLIALAQTFGMSELDCVVAFAKDVIKSKVGLSPAEQEAIRRADEWLTTHGKTSMREPANRAISCPSSPARMAG